MSQQVLVVLVFAALNVWCSVWCSVSADGVVKSKSCSDVAKQCYSWTGCSQALFNVVQYCPKLGLRAMWEPQPQASNANKRKSKKAKTNAKNETTATRSNAAARIPSCGQMDELCMQAISALLTVEYDEIGTNFISCSCAGDEECELDRLRIASCVVKPAEQMRLLVQDQTSPHVPCSLAAFYCDADTGCATAMQFAEKYCTNLLSSKPDPRHSLVAPQCSTKCNHSLNVLFNRERGRQLQRCTCDYTSKSMQNTEMQKFCAFGRIRQACSNQVKHIGAVVHDALSMPINTNDARTASQAGLLFLLPIVYTFFKYLSSTVDSDLCS